MTNAYCTGQQAFDLINGLRITPNSPDLNQTAADRLVGSQADDITDLLNLLGYGPVKNATIEQIATALNSSQSLILAACNVFLAGYDLIQRRGGEIDPRYESISSQHKVFLFLIFNWLKTGRLLAAWNANNPRYPIPTNRPFVNSQVFSGTGTDNLITSGTFTGYDNETITVELTDSTHFHWKKNSDSYSAPIVITGSAQLLTDGISITIPAGTHNASDKWTITITVFACAASIGYLVSAWNPTDSAAQPSKAIVDVWLNWWTAIVYALAARRGYPVATLNDGQASKYGEIISQFVAAMVLQAKQFKEPGARLDAPTLYRMNEAISAINLLLRGKFNKTFVG